jgi:alkanesulfonate monooxygenase SsuD/methylene tetrahydromethanopterin reductase-like flavin-dependent oxidoreductase (luciferase family)
LTTVVTAVPSRTRRLGTRCDVVDASEAQRPEPQASEGVRFAVGAPNVAAFADPSFLVDLAASAEEAGWDGFFVWDHLFYRPPDGRAVEPWSIVAAAAAATSRIRLGVLMTAVPRRRPALLAQQVATIDLLSGGRVVFGAGLGSMPEEYTRFGEDDDLAVRARKLDEALEVMRALWSGDSVTHHGEFFTVKDAMLRPRPLDGPPIWIAGRWPNRAPFRRAARYDGVMPTHAAHAHGSFMTSRELRTIVEYVEAHRIRGGRIAVVMEGESTSAHQLADIVPSYARAGLTWWVEKLGWWRGDLDVARRRVEAGPPGPAR